jgi:hypothetical protein
MKGKTGLLLAVLLVALTIVAACGGDSAPAPAAVEKWTITTNMVGPGPGGKSSYTFEAVAGGHYDGETTSGCELCCSGWVDTWSVNSSGNLAVTFHCDMATGTLTGIVSGTTVSGNAACTQNNSRAKPPATPGRIEKAML